MKKFLLILFLAGAIGIFIYLSGGNSLADLTSSDGPISKSGFTELKDQVLGSFTVEDGDLENLDEAIASTTESISSDTDDDGPLSNLLKQFRSETSKEEAESNNTQEQNNTTEKQDNSTTTEEYINQIESDTNLPEFDLVCFPEIKRECDFEGCETSSPDLNFTLISSSQNLIHKCSFENCNTFDYQGRQYSDSYNYQIQSEDQMYMISRDLEADSSGRTAYAEVRAQGTNTIINLGRCLGK